MQIYILLIFLLLLVIGIYLFITQAHRSTYWNYLSISMQAIAILGIISLWNINYFIPDATSNEHGIYKYIHLWISEHISTYLSAFVALVYIVIVYFAQHNYHQKILKEDGVFLNAKIISITRKEKEKPGEFKIEYNFNGKMYQQTIIQSEHNYTMNDNIQIRCSQTNPTIYEIIK